MRYSIAKRGASLIIGRFLLVVRLHDWRLRFANGMWAYYLELGPLFFLWEHRTLDMRWDADETQAAKVAMEKYDVA